MSTFILINDVTETLSVKNNMNEKIYNRLQYIYTLFCTLVVAHSLEL